MNSKTSLVPPAWADLIRAVTLLAKGQSNTISPFHCEHDKLTVCADPAKFTQEELDRLEKWGFDADAEDECFYSFRYGSA